MATEEKPKPLIEWPFEPYYEDGYDQIDQDSDWEYLTDYLTELMGERNTGDRWYAEVTDFGWRAQRGYRVFRAEDGQELLDGILPKTDNSFRIYDHLDGKALRINNAHHDSPVWREWYTVLPCLYSVKDEAGNLLMEAPDNTKPLTWDDDEDAERDVSQDSEEGRAFTIVQAITGEEVRKFTVNY